MNLFLRILDCTSHLLRSGNKSLLVLRFTSALLHKIDDTSALVCLAHISLNNRKIASFSKHQGRTLFVTGANSSHKGTRKSQTTKAASTPVRYCSDRCRHNKPSQAPGSVDRRISDAFIALLDGRSPSPALSQDAIEAAGLSLPRGANGSQKKVKGETRITVSCDDVEAIVFGARHDPDKAFGRKKNRAPRGAPEPKEWKSVDMEDSGNDTHESVYAKLHL